MQTCLTYMSDCHSKRGAITMAMTKGQWVFGRTANGLQHMPSVLREEKGREH